MGRRLAACIGTALALTAAVPAAQAAPQTVKQFAPSHRETPGSLYPYYSFSGPELAGPVSVAWARSLPGGGWVVETANPGGPGSQVIARVVRPASDYHLIGLVGASATRIAWTDIAFYVVNAHDGRVQVVRDGLYATDRPGMERAVMGCGGPSTPPCACQTYCDSTPPAADLEGNVLAYVEGDFSDRTIVVDDLASEADPVRVPAGSGVFDFVRIAGDRLLYLDISTNQPVAVVYDWRASRELYRVRTGQYYALQSDGKLAVVGTDGRLRWYRADGSQGGVIEPGTGRRFAEVRMAADRLAIRDERDSGGDRRLRVDDLNGATRAFAGGATAPAGMTARSFDFDGRRAAWVSLECGVTSVIVESDVLSPSAGPRPAARCLPPAITDLRVTDRGLLVADVVCARGCRGTFNGYRITPPDSKLGYRRLDLSASPKRRRISFRPPAAERERLRRPGATRVHVHFSGRDGGGHPVGAGRVGTVKRP